VPLTVGLLHEAQLHEVRGVRVEELPRLCLCHWPALLGFDCRASFTKYERSFDRSFFSSYSTSFAKEFAECGPNSRADSKPRDDDASHRCHRSASDRSRASSCDTGDARRTRG